MLALFISFPGTLVLPNQVPIGAPLKQTSIYKTVGDCRIKADLYRPEGTAILPVIFWIHGGALISGDRNSIRKDQLESYLENGFAVFSIDYRLAPETKLPAIVSDLKDAYRWLRKESKRLRLDPDRIAVVGHSAGGYLTLMAGSCLRPRPKALVSFYGYGDIVGEWYSRPDPHYSQQPAVPKSDAYSVVGGPPISENAPGDRFKFYLYCRQNGLWPKEVAGFVPDKEPKRFIPYCPVRNVTHDYPPTLLLHGDQDTDVPYAQSVQMHEELDRQHVSNELITISGGGYGFDGARKRDAKVGEAFERVLGFLHTHLDPTAP